MHIINLRHASSLEVLQEPLMPTDHASLPQIDMDKIQRRLDRNVEAKWKRVRSLGVNVSEQTQQLFNYIGKLWVVVRF